MSFSCRELNYFPGCSLATTAKENNASLTYFLEQFDIRLTEIPDWNCCGSSSTHSIDGGLALALASRNLFLAPKDKPLLIACPGCHLRLREAKWTLGTNAEKRCKVEEHFGEPFHADLKLLHFLSCWRT